MLHIEAERREEERREEKGYLRQELRYGPVSRSLPLLEGVTEAGPAPSRNEVARRRLAGRSATRLASPAGQMGVPLSAADQSTDSGGARNDAAQTVPPAAGRRGVPMGTPSAHASVRGNPRAARHA